MADRMTIPPPSRPASIEEAARAARIRAEQGDATDVVMPSIHNWVEMVYRAFRQALPTGAKELALLGVRESGRSAGATQDDDTYSRGSRPADRGENSREIGDATTSFNDLVFLVWCEVSVEEGTSANIYACTIDPSIDLDSTKGSPYLLEGKLYKAFPGPHGSKARPSLHLYTGSQEHIDIAREATKSQRTFTGVNNALVSPTTGGPQRWEFVANEANGTFHMHYGFDYESTSHLAKDWSAGCTVLMHGHASDAYKDFIALGDAAPNSQEIPYLVVSSDYVKLPDEWAQYAVDDPDKLKDPNYVMRETGLRAAPLGLGWLPSIMSWNFGETVVELADEVDRVMAGGAVANVRHLADAMEAVLSHEDRLPASVPAPLKRWLAALNAEKEPVATDVATAVAGLSGLSTHLRASLARACFQCVVAPKRGPQ